MLASNYRQTVWIWHTLVDELQFRDNVKANLGKLVLQHLQEHWEQVVDSPTTESVIAQCWNCVFATYSCLPKMGASPLI